MADKKNLSNPRLVQNVSVAQFVIQQLLKGLEIKLEIDGIFHTGYVHSLDFSVGGPHAFASVVIDEGDELTIYVNVCILADGTVKIMPIQPEA